MSEIGSIKASQLENGGSKEISVTGLSGLLADAQTPLAHNTSHQNGGADEINLAGLAGQALIIPCNGKIADITHNDSTKHTLDLAAALSETRTIISIFMRGARQSGTGNLNVYPNEGTLPFNASYADIGSTVVIAAGTNRLQYALSVANDDFDLYCGGYTVLST